MFTSLFPSFMFLPCPQLLLRHAFPIPGISFVSWSKPNHNHWFFSLTQIHICPVLIQTIVSDKNLDDKIKLLWCQDFIEKTNLAKTKKVMLLVAPIDFLWKEKYAAHESALNLLSPSTLYHLKQDGIK